jgi:3-deoxy-D-manno-octulosonic acid (KDO) 8-phosphate synthase
LKAELLARAEAADHAEVVDGMSIPEKLARREDRLAKAAQARAKIEARHGTLRAGGGRPPAAPVEGP